MYRVFKKSKTGLVFLAAVLTLIIVLSACSANGTDQGQTTTTAKATTKATTTAATSATTEEVLPKEVSILLSHANVTYTKEATSWEADPYVIELERLTGYDLHFEFLGHADYIQMLTMRFASGELPDLIRTDSIESAAHATAVENDIIVEVGTLLEQYGANILKGIPENEWTNPKVSKDGKIYGIPALLERDSSNVIFIRQDWLDKFNMKAPETLDDWIVYFENVKALNTDPNADPNTKIYGLLVRENLSYSKVFFKQFDVHPDTWQLNNGQFEPSMISPRMKEAIKFWKMLYDKGYVNPNMFTMTGNDWANGFIGGKGGAIMHDAISFETAFYPARFADQPGAKLSMIGAPTGYKGEKGLSPKSSRHYFTFVIPTKTKYPQVVVQLLDLVWGSDEIDTFHSFGIEGRNYKNENGKIIWDKTALGFDKQEYLVHQLSVNLRGSNMSAEKVLNLMPTAETVMEGYKTASENAFENLAMFMPAIEVFKTSPELNTGARAGTMFLDMFAKTVTGVEDVDTAFDNFVAEWKRRGGDEAIKQATEWYNSFYK